MFIKPSHLYKIWGSLNPVSIALLPLSALYLPGHSINMIFRKSKTAPLPVICIGNITVGGTGKTPLALYIADMLADEGIKAHILMRGYGGSIKKSTMVNICTHSAGEVGDEALMLAARHTVWIGTDRQKSAILAKDAGADVVIMDDGLQSRQLQRNLTLIVLDGAFGLGNRLPLPAGALREPWQSGLERADAVVIMGDSSLAINRNYPGVGTNYRLSLPCTKGARGGHLASSHSTNTCPPLIPFVHRGETSNVHPGQQTCEATINLPASWQARIVPMPPQHLLQSDGVYSYRSVNSSSERSDLRQRAGGRPLAGGCAPLNIEKDTPLEFLPQSNSSVASGVYAFAGIGRPEKFFESLAQAGVQVVETKEFPDHHSYTVCQVEEMLQLCTRNGLSLVTTEKDFVKLPDSLKEKIIAIPARVEFSAPEDFKQFILNNFKNPPRA